MHGLPAVHRSPITCLWPPVDGPVVEPFRQPACPYCAGHRGITYDTTVGQTVRAVADGRVDYAGTVAGTRYVVVRHADGRRATYGRLLTLAVVVGQTVRAGDRVGTAGETLHLGLRSGDTYLDPGPLLGILRRAARLVPFGTAVARPARPGRPAGPDRLICPGARVGGVPSPLR